MKYVVSLVAALFVTGWGMAQTDSTGRSSDTIKVGNLIIIKKKKSGSGDE